MSKNDGGPAFPTTGRTYENDRGEKGMLSRHIEMEGGMTLRDWFAGQALAGILSGGFADTIPHDDINGGSDAAHFAYQYADAMLKARQETN